MALGGRIRRAFPHADSCLPRSMLSNLFASFGAAKKKAGSTDKKHSFTPPVCISGVALLLYTDYVTSLLPICFALFSKQKSSPADGSRATTLSAHPKDNAATALSAPFKALKTVPQPADFCIKSKSVIVGPATVFARVLAACDWQQLPTLIV